MVEYIISDKNVQNVTQIEWALLILLGLEPREITSHITDVDDVRKPPLIHSTLFQNFQVTLKNN
jgi:hypothetical protein